MPDVHGAQSMRAERIDVTKGPRERAFDRCREVLHAGGVIAYPTDTFYGLGADPRSVPAVNRLFSVKGRRADRPILLLVPDVSTVDEWADFVPEAARRLMDRFWPGPLTLVLPARRDVLPLLTGNTGRIGLRVPGCELTRAILYATGSGLTGTSANQSGGRPPCTAEDVIRELGDRIDLVLDGGVSGASAPSTVVDVTSGQLRVIREGAVSLEELGIAASGIVRGASRGKEGT